ncbi:ABC transporter ATP-binding protein [Paenibacillus planticolens]|uniref:ATP-binding cassette domain-containing protein n=1 Tax=Paenibacillus planticolens TaxID=2654976 RepID=A0ABX1ZP00_9BACL|nr:ABC transporter ATP-binding protein [Paenibacillus planticolens]NOV00607.1 ATP-binding cassette domain-containing protein [Paenibacillus planticolens]
MLVVDSVEKLYRKDGFFSTRKQHILENITFSCGYGECLGIIGESGSGKSTLGRLIAGIEKPDRGSILLEGKNVADRTVRSGNISVVFQDYTSSINPFFTVEQAIMEPLSLRNKGITENHSKLDHLLRQVGLPSSYRMKYPHELSGGEVQRVCIARAISTEPQCIVLDEAISSLDVSVQTQVLELLQDLKDIYRMSYIFITHDMQAAAYLCDRVMIFRNGKIEEIVPIEQLQHVQSAYARTLLQRQITF